MKTVLQSRLLGSLLLAAMVLSTGCNREHPSGQPSPEAEKTQSDIHNDEPIGELPKMDGRVAGGIASAEHENYDSSSVDMIAGSTTLQTRNGLNKQRTIQRQDDGLLEKKFQSASFNFERAAIRAAAFRDRSGKIRESLEVIRNKGKRLRPLEMASSKALIARLDARATIIEAQAVTDYANAATENGTFEGAIVYLAYSASTYAAMAARNAEAAALELQAEAGKANVNDRHKAMYIATANKLLDVAREAETVAKESESAANDAVSFARTNTP